MYEREQNARHNETVWETGWRGMFAVSTRVLLSRPFDAYEAWIRLLQKNECKFSRNDCGMEIMLSVFFRCDRELFVNDATEYCLNPANVVELHTETDGIKALATDATCNNAFLYDRIEVRGTLKAPPENDGIYRCLKRLT